MAKNKKLHKSKRISFPLLVIFFIGISLMVLAAGIKVNKLRSLSFAGSLPASISKESKSNPTTITIADSGIDLPVKETYIVNNAWGIYADGASHLNTSANPGENGNIIIYAHNTNDRFGSLNQIKVGSVIKLNTKDNKTYVYEVKKISVVNPDDISLLLPASHEKLTIYTCTGFADLKRLVVQAEPISL